MDGIIEHLDPTIVVASISIIVAVISLAGTLYMAKVGVHNAQLSAADKIAIGSSELLEEYRIELKKERDQRRSCNAAIDEMKVEIDRLKRWKNIITAFIYPLVEGSKANEAQLIELAEIPRYRVPPIPSELRLLIDKNDK